MCRQIQIRIDGRTILVPAGTTVAAALIGSGVPSFRVSVTGEPRGPLCGIGICLECRVTIDGVPHSRSCQTPCAEGMEVRTDAPR